MASSKFKQNFCRICLVQNLNMMDWNDDLPGFCGTTYKDCYYKYTQLEQLVVDPFSSMLCEICSKDLKNAHLLIEKALQSYKILHQKLIPAKRNCDENLDNTFVTPLVIIKPEPVGFEMLVFKQSMDPLRVDAQIDKECAEMALIGREKDSMKVKPNLRAYEMENTRSKGLSAQCASEESENSRNVSPSLITPDEFPKESSESDKEREIFSGKLKSPRNGRRKQRSKKASRTQPKVTSNEDVNKSAPKKKTRMCSYCSKLIIGIAKLKAHEDTHKEHRERAVTCPVCDLKLLNKGNLDGHMKVHVENREKNYKCDFCDKSFFNRGTLNIHRRLHLGQMISCPLCSKQYFRQIDLDKHMNSHSATPINSDVKKRSRYYVYCKDCNKSMLSSSWKAHEAVHKNEPLMKCSICTKDFFCRKSCVTHMKKVHHKTSREEYENFIIYYTKPRLSRLMLEQQKIIQPVP